MGFLREYLENKEWSIIMNKKNTEKPIVQASGYSNGKVMRLCPNCKKEKPLEDFGFRIMDNNIIRNQSWCKKCRAKINK